MLKVLCYSGSTNGHVLLLLIVQIIHYHMIICVAIEGIERALIVSI